MKIRPVEVSDASEIVAIYNPFIATSTITFEYDLIDETIMKGRIEKILAQGFPWFSAVLDGRVVGYAYAGTWRERAAFRYVVECAIYIDPDFTGQGIGKSLYATLFADLRARGIRSVVAGITVPNEASQAIHTSFGFEKAGFFKSVGYKFEKWIDVEFWQLDLT